MLSASMICEMLCEIITTVRLRLISSKLSLIYSLAMASKLAVGSYKKIIEGSFRKSRAMAIRCCLIPQVDQLYTLKYVH